MYFLERYKKMTSKGILGIHEVNALDEEEFIWLFNNVVELHPQAAKTVEKQKPFSTAEDLKKGFDNYLENLDDQGKFFC